MCTHNARKELHHEDLVVEGEALVVAIEQVIKPLGEGLGVVKELKSREVGRGDIGFPVVLL